MGSNEPDMSARLKVVIEDLEELEKERLEILERVKRVKEGARIAGLHIGTINAILKERRMTAAEVRQREALLQLYRAALGMLGDTPLGTAALQALQPSPPQQPDAGESLPGFELPPAAAQPAPVTPQDVLRVRAEGAAAQKAGKPVLANPYAAGDPLRAAWDEGWCAACGGDGMEIPAAFRAPPRPPKGGKPSGKPGGEGT